MEQLILEIEVYCSARQIAPQKLLRDTINATWGLWQKWKDGEASPTMKVADRIRAHMAAHPAEVVAEPSPTPTAEDAA
jgi:hypothetical protein